MHPNIEFDEYIYVHKYSVDYQWCSVGNNVSQQNSKEPCSVHDNKEHGVDLMSRHFEGS